jgi:hypothetical protein
MFKVIFAWLVVLNASSIRLHETMLIVNDESFIVGDIRIGESKMVEIPKVDSVRVVFQLGDEWIGTSVLPMQDTIKIENNTETFNVEILQVEE